MVSGLNLQTARRVVIKIGSSLLVAAGTGELREHWLQSLAKDVTKAHQNGQEVILVSSGAIALGRGVLGLGASDLALEHAQAAAAVGQIRLAQAYQEVLAPFGLKTAQILMTLDDSLNRRRYLNSRATLETLLGLGVIPIVNENDTIATDEIRFGDNDRLAAQIAVMASADCLVLLSDVDGFYAANPMTYPAAQHFPMIEGITPDIEAMAGVGVSGLSKGGMVTKLMAARTAMDAGCAMVIAKGDILHPLTAIQDGARVTWFKPKDDPQLARKRWIAAMKPKGALAIDAGAVAALKQGKSLLPAGVTYVGGTFGRGEPVSIEGPDGQAMAKGLCRYTAEEARIIKGHQTRDIAPLLGYAGRAALIHRDDMVLM